MGADAGDYEQSGRQGLVVGNFTNEGLDTLSRRWYRLVQRPVFVFGG